MGRPRVRLRRRRTERHRRDGLGRAGGLRGLLRRAARLRSGCARSGRSADATRPADRDVDRVRRRSRRAPDLRRFCPRCDLVRGVGRRRAGHGGNALRAGHGRRCRPRPQPSAPQPRHHHPRRRARQHGLRATDRRARRVRRVATRPRRARRRRMRGHRGSARCLAPRRHGHRQPTRPDWSEGPQLPSSPAASGRAALGTGCRDGDDRSPRRAPPRPGNGAPRRQFRARRHGPRQGGWSPASLVPDGCQAGSQRGAFSCKASASAYPCSPSSSRSSSLPLPWRAPDRELRPSCDRSSSSTTLAPVRSPRSTLASTAPAPLRGRWRPSHSVPAWPSSVGPPRGSCA